MNRKIENMIISLVLSATIVLLMYLSGALAKSVHRITGVSDVSTWLSFIGVMLGTAIAILGAYLISQIEVVQKQKDSERHAKAIVGTFLMIDIEFNNSILNFEHVNTEVINAEQKNTDYINYGIDSGVLRMVEFDRIKYELLKSDSEYVKSVLRYFSYIRNIDVNKGYSRLKISEIRDLFELSKAILNDI